MWQFGLHTAHKIEMSLIVMTYCYKHILVLQKKLINLWNKIALKLFHVHVSFKSSLETKWEK